MCKFISRTACLLSHMQNEILHNGVSALPHVYHRCAFLTEKQLVGAIATTVFVTSYSTYAQRNHVVAPVKFVCCTRASRTISLPPLQYLASCFGVC
jgi:hypothetical protein